MKKSNVPARGLVKTDGIPGAFESKINALAPFARLILKLISRSPVAGSRGSKPFWNPLGADVTWPEPSGNAAPKEKIPNGWAASIAAAACAVSTWLTANAPSGLLTAYSGDRDRSVRAIVITRSG